MPLLHWAMPSKYHSIQRNDLARAMVAQSEQVFLAIAQPNPPKEATVKFLEYKETEPFSSRARPMSLESLEHAICVWIEALSKRAEFDGRRFRRRGSQLIDECRYIDHALTATNCYLRVKTKKYWFARNS
jgi:hypothetical protein